MVLACKGDLQWALAMDLIREAANKGLRVRTNHLHNYYYVNQAYRAKGVQRQRRREAEA